MSSHKKYMQLALDIAIKSAKSGTGPFGCVIIKNGKIISEAYNEVTKLFDPTAHAEIQAIRKACKKLRSHQLTDCIIYTSCFPCPQCLGAIYWARPKKVYYMNTTAQAKKFGFDDKFVYKEIKKTNSKRLYKIERVLLPNHMKAFEAWGANDKKIVY